MDDGGWIFYLPSSPFPPFPLHTPMTTLSKQSSLLLLLAGLMLSCAAPQEEADGWVTLFNGKDLSGWDTYLGPETTEAGEPGQPFGLNNDPRQVFQVVEVEGAPALMISGEIGGGISTVAEYENYPLTMEFKWGIAMPWASRPKRDSGVLYHAVGPHGVDYGFWMRSQEFQIQEGDCGDYWGVAGGIFDIPSIQNGAGDYVFNRAGTLHTFEDGRETGRHCIKDPDAEKPSGEWNSIDLYVSADTSVHVVNGQVTMILYNSRQAGEGGALPLTRGKIQIQSEGAEVYYRNIRLQPIDMIPDQILE